MQIRSENVRGNTLAPIIVDTGLGRVSGTDGAVRRFLGLRYAQPPAAETRWRAPTPVAPWTGVLPADQFGDDFPQAADPLLRAVAQSEDCLRLNIWAPAEPPAGGAPVLVWFHGGGFTRGSGSDLRCDGEAFARQGILVVTFNYRSGLFGFFAHPALSAESPEGISGNYGLLDQMAALRWVREHIAAFGGAPDRITVAGVSAGSASIALLLTIPRATGLFDQAILHSPGSCRPLGKLADAEQAGLVLGADIHALRSLSAKELLGLTSRMVPKMRSLTGARLLRPIRDGVLVPGDELPALEARRFMRVPLIVGTNEDEGSKLTRDWTVDSLDAYHRLLQENFGPAAEEAMACYPASNDAQVRARVAELFADTQFNYGAWRLALAMAPERPTYRYVFRRRAAGAPDGPHHGDEVPYAFDTLARMPEAAKVFDEGDQRTADAMHGAWVRFIKTGDVNGAGLPPWPVYDPAHGEHMTFDDPPMAGRHWRAGAIGFIDRVQSQRYRTEGGHE
ncbi:MAG: carboxylesterase family protein [Burkholderiaceae bacterium]